MKCKKCGEDKELNEFVKNKNCKLGVERTCKDCNKKHKQLYAQSNKEYIKKKKKENYESKKTIILEKQKKYVNSNKEKIRVRNKNIERIIKVV